MNERNKIPGTRPAVLSAGTIKGLDEYLRFRHVVRNVYTFEFDAGRLERLVVNLRPCFERVWAELKAYTDFLDQVNSG